MGALSRQEGQIVAARDAASVPCQLSMVQEGRRERGMEERGCKDSLAISAAPNASLNAGD